MGAGVDKDDSNDFDNGRKLLNSIKSFIVGKIPFILRYPLLSAAVAFVIIFALDLFGLNQILVAALGVLGGVTTLIASSLKTDTIPINSNDTYELRFKELKLKLDAIEASSVNLGRLLSEDDQKKVRDGIIERVHSELARETVKAEVSSMLDLQLTALSADYIENWSQMSTRRLVQQISALGSRANLNLLIGLCLAIFGVGFLVFYLEEIAKGPP